MLRVGEMMLRIGKDTTATANDGTLDESFMKSLQHLVTFHPQTQPVVRPQRVQQKKQQKQPQREESVAPVFRFVDVPKRQGPIFQLKRQESTIKTSQALNEGAQKPTGGTETKETQKQTIDEYLKKIVTQSNEKKPTRSMLSLTGIIFPCDLLVLLLMNSQDNEKLRALQIAQGVNRGKSGTEAYQGLVDSPSPSSVATAKQLSTWVESTTRNEPHPKLLVSGIRCAVMWERHDSKCRLEFATLDPVLITLLCLVAMFKLLLLSAAAVTGLHGRED